MSCRYFFDISRSRNKVTLSMHAVCVRVGGITDYIYIPQTKYRIDISSYKILHEINYRSCKKQNII